MITAAQREVRRKHIGASDAAAILGFDQWRSREDVWIEKTVGTEPDKGSDAIDLGNELEPVIVSWAGKQIREELEPGIPFDGSALDIDTSNPQFLHTGGVMLAHPDGLVRHAHGWKAPIEAKYRSRGMEWGDNANPQVPIEVLIQTTHQMLCVGATFCWVAAYLAERYGITKRLIRAELDADMAKTVQDELHLFWERYVLPRKQPPPSEKGPSLEVMKRIRRLPDTVVSVDATTMVDFVVAREERLEAEKREEAAKARLLMQMCGAECAKAAGWVATNKLVKRNDKPREARVVEYQQLLVKQIQD
jgi:predicted phage-related endonuclease